MEKVSDYDFTLPLELVAQYPAAIRGDDRLLVLDRRTGSIFHRRFTDLPDYLQEGDVLVLNDSRVILARLHGKKPTGGKVEVFLVRPFGKQSWLCLVRAPRGVKKGLEIQFDNRRSAHVVDMLPEGLWEVAFEGFKSARSIHREIGSIPLPPYIQRAPEPVDKERYQTVYAAKDGSVAAPTAGLHFTEAFLNCIASNGVEPAKITLHVGPGTFRPMRGKTLEEHQLDSEAFSINEQAGRVIQTALEEGRRVIAVGTTVTRALEHVARTDGTVTAKTGWTDLFIRPPYEFRVVSALLTNFHLPRSSLLVLVAAFARRQNVINAYHEAVRRQYRFYSYGDAMLII